MRKWRQMTIDVGWTEKMICCMWGEGNGAGGFALFGFECVFGFLYIYYFFCGKMLFAFHQREFIVYWLFLCLFLILVGLFFLEAHSYP